MGHDDAQFLRENFKSELLWKYNPLRGLLYFLRRNEKTQGKSRKLNAISLRPLGASRWRDGLYPRAKMMRWLADQNNEALTADGLDEAFIGVVNRHDLPAPIAVYDRDRCIDILVQRDGLSYDDAVEHFEVNIIGAWVGENTPMYLEQFQRDVS